MNNLTGILLVIMAMAGFTIEDIFIKRLSADLPVGQILIGLGSIGALIFASLARFKGHRLFAAAAWQPMFIIRALCEACAAIGFAVSLSLVDISIVASVFQVTPLTITMGAALFLGESVGWRRWSAILIGFLGVLLIIRPGLAGFDPYALLVLIAVFFVSARDLITRRIDWNVTSTVISFQGFSVLVPAGAVLMAFSAQTYGSATGSIVLMLVCAAIFGTIGYWGIVQAMRVGDASVVTPFRYTRLLFSLLAGVVVFSERPDTITLLGAGLITVTGLFSLWRESRQSHKATR